MTTCTAQASTLCYKGVCSGARALHGVDSWTSCPYSYICKSRFNIFALPAATTRLFDDRKGARVHCWGTDKANERTGQAEAQEWTVEIPIAHHFAWCVPSVACAQTVGPRVSHYCVHALPL